MNEDIMFKIITKFLMKYVLYKEDMLNYRPISRLSLTSKFIENITTRSIEEQLEDNDLYDSYQSSYCRGY